MGFLENFVGNFTKGAKEGFETTIKIAKNPTRLVDHLEKEHRELTENDSEANEYVEDVKEFKKNDLQSLDFLV